MKIVDILDKLSTARVEFKASNHSVLDQFVVPTFIDHCDLRSLSHSISLAGSRGCGKTTYVRYFSHWTRFDPKRQDVEESEFDCIILYWKPDITYCRGLTPNWLGDQSIQFFMLHAALEIMLEICWLLKNCISHFPAIEDNLKNGNFWDALNDVTGEQLQSLDAVIKWIKKVKYDLSSRVNDRRTEGMIQINVNATLEYLVDALKDDCPYFERSKFKVYVDEFEHLTDEQQSIINTFRKHSKMTINWNVAYKSNASPSVKTASDEWLQSPDDYREINLDSFIKEEFEVYAAEIFLLTLQNTGLKCSIGEVTPRFLGDRKNVNLRKQKDYKNKILLIIYTILPTPTVKELSEYALKIKVIKGRISELKKSLKLISADQFKKIMAMPELAITMWGIHHQANFREQDIIGYLNGEEAASKRIKEKIHTFQYNTLLTLNLQFAYVQIPVYAGFKRFEKMSTPNVRHFKELCYNSLKQVADQWIDNEINDIETFPPVDIEALNQGAIATSTAQVKEIVNYPPHGRLLATLTYRLGELFAISQKSLRQTEPERSIFRIEYDFEGASSSLSEIIQSGVSWRVLIEQQSKRERSKESTSYNREFYLNPIYAPHFGITFRVKRDITLSVKEFDLLLNGSDEQYTELRRRYIRKWKVSDESIQPDLLI